MGQVARRCEPETECARRYRRMVERIFCCSFLHAHTLTLQNCPYQFRVLPAAHGDNHSRNRPFPAIPSTACAFSKSSGAPGLIALRHELEDLTWSARFSARGFLS